MVLLESRNGDVATLEEEILLNPLIDDTMVNTGAYIDQLMPLIKKSIKQNTLDQLLSTMEDSIFDKETELQKLAFDSSRDVLESVSTVKQIKKSSGELSQQVMLIQKELQKTGLELTRKKKLLINYKKIHNKITETIFVLQSCLQILQLTRNIMDLISKNNFYNALKLLDELTSLQSNNQSFENFEFARKIFDSIPRLTTMCKDDSITYIQRWLTNSLERNFADIGESSMNEITRIADAWINTVNENHSLRKYKVNSGVELSMRKNSGFDPLYDIDLKPLYDGILVYETLGEEETLRTKFHGEWLNKRDRLLKDLKQSAAPNHMGFNNLDDLRVFLRTTLGFLVSDHLINIKTGYKLRSDANLKDLYESIISKLCPCLNSYLKDKINNLQDLEDFKVQVGLFVQSLDNYGYNVEQLYKVLIATYQKFTALKFHEFERSYQEVIENDDSLPMTVTDRSILLKICSVAYYKLPEDEQITFPRALPFSQIYLDTCAQLKGFINEHETFVLRYYSHQLPLLDKILVNSLDEVLTKVVVKHLSSKLNSTIKEELAQNLINLEFFSNLIKELEKLISRNAEYSLYLKSYDLFIQLRKNAESKMFEMVDSKVMDLIESAEWDFKSTLSQSDPSIFIRDIGEFLEMMFNTNFNNLPSSIRQLLLFRSFDLIADHFLAQIRNTPIISSAALQNFDIDIEYLENIVNSMNDAVKPQRDQHQSLSINSTFIELNQVMDLLKSASLTYFKQHQNTKFTRIKVDEAASYIDKLESVQMERRLQMLLEAGDDDNSDLMSITSTNGKHLSAGLETASRFARFKFRNKE